MSAQLNQGGVLSVTSVGTDWFSSIITENVSIFSHKGRSLVYEADSTQPSVMQMAVGEVSLEDLVPDFDLEDLWSSIEPDDEFPHLNDLGMANIEECATAGSPSLSPFPLAKATSLVEQATTPTRLKGLVLLSGPLEGCDCRDSSPSPSPSPLATATVVYATSSVVHVIMPAKRKALVLSSETLEGCNCSDWGADLDRKSKHSYSAMAVKRRRYST